MIEVDVIAKDKHGHAVADLEANELTLLDDGRPQKIARVSVERGPADLTAGKAATEAATPPLQTVFSNTHPGNVAPTVILFDVLNTAAEDQASMKKGLLESLHHLKDDTPVALLVLGDDLTVVSDFTTSTISLTQAANSRFDVRPEGFGPSIGLRSTGNPVFDAMILKVATKVFPAEDHDRTARTVAALNIICRQLSLIPGRKSLLWVTGGLNMTREWQSAEDAMDRLNDANIAVYTVDARGVQLDPGIGADSDYNDLTQPLKEEREEKRGDVLDVIARETGGVRYRNTNRLDGVIGRAMEDRSVVYAIEYYPRHGDWHGKVHKLEVKTSRPGVHLRYRASYRATLPAAPSAQEKDQMLAAVASAPLEYSGIRFSVEMKPGSPADPRFVLHVPVEQMQWSSEQGKMLGSLRVWLIQKRSSGDDLVTNTLKDDVRFWPDEYQAVAHDGVSLSTDLKVQSNAAKVRVLVRDENSGKIGSVDVAVEPAH